MSHRPYVPNEILDLLNEKFSFPKQPLFGSVATVKNHIPNIRTMRIYELNQEGCPILLTHTESNKWKEFTLHPHVAINMVSENKLLQIIVSGDLLLTTPESTQDRSRYWNMIRSDVKKIYDPAHKVEEIYCDIDELTCPIDVPHTLGIASLVPTFLETLQLESEYTKSYRYQFHWKEGGWQKQRIHVG